MVTLQLSSSSPLLLPWSRCNCTCRRRHRCCCCGCTAPAAVIVVATAVAVVALHLQLSSSLPLLLPWLGCSCTVIVTVGATTSQIQSKLLKIRRIDSKNKNEIKRKHTKGPAYAHWPLSPIQTYICRIFSILLF